MSYFSVRAACVAALLFLCSSPGADAQDEKPKNRLNLSVAFLNSDAASHYFGASFSYSRLISRTMAVKLDAAAFPETMERSGAYGGGRITSTTGALLAGWLGSQISIQAEIGGGTLAPMVALGASTLTTATFGVRRYPVVILGGVIEKRLSRHYALTYEVRDNWTFISATSEYVVGYAIEFPAIQRHELEGRGGFTLRF